MLVLGVRGVGGVLLVTATLITSFGELFARLLSVNAMRHQLVVLQAALSFEGFVTQLQGKQTGYKNELMWKIPWFHLDSNT